MAGPPPEVAVIGLRALNRDIQKLCDNRGDINRAFQQAGRTAAEPVASAARAAFPQSNTDHAGRLAGDVRVTASRSGAAVRVGRSTIRYAPWVEFGGRRHLPHESARPFVSTGRYLFPAGRQLASTSAQLYSDALTRALEQFGWTNPSSAAPEAVHD